MNPPLKFIMALVAVAGIFSPAVSQAQNNTAYGVGALHSGTKTGIDDSAFGAYALYLDVSGGYNTATGVNALFNNKAGYNTADGQGSLYSNTTGSDDTAVGYQALHLNTTGRGNTANGYQALYNNVSGYDNTAFGFQALENEGTNGTPGLTIGDTAIGFEAVQTDNSIYGEATSVGYLALQTDNSAYGTDTAVGAYALQIDYSDGFDTAVGWSALQHDNSSGYNTAIGWSTLQNAYSESGRDTAIGYSALVNDYSANGSNTAIGCFALTSNTTGAENTVVGYSALSNNTTGANNIAIGYQAGATNTTGTNNIYIGSPSVAGDDSAIRIGNPKTEGKKTCIAGIYDATVTGSPVYVDSSGHLGLQAISSRRFKQDIKSMGDASDAVLSLKPVTYEYKPDIDPKRVPQFGLVAEDVEKACPNLVIHDKEGKPYAVRYDAVNVMLLNEFLKEHERVEEQGKQLAAQEQINAAQKQQFASQEQINAQQQREITSLAAALKEQASLLQKVSEQMEINKPAPQLVSNKN